MAVKRFKLTEENSKLTSEELNELEKAAKKGQKTDPDFPPFTPEQLMKFRRISEVQKEERASNRKQNVTIRLSPATIKKAKSLGKGYTGILAQIIEEALNNPAATEKFI